MNDHRTGVNLGTEIAGKLLNCRISEPDPDKSHKKMIQAGGGGSCRFFDSNFN